MSPATERRHHVLSIDDIDDTSLRVILGASRVAAEVHAPSAARDLVLASVFLSSSLRTRIGFQAAALRLGGSVVDVAELRDATSMTQPESLADTLRTVAGMCDVIVCRTGGDHRLDHELVSPLPCPVINGGDASEHPSQALIDFESIEYFKGPIGELTVAIHGDLTMRAVTSLLKLLARFPPCRLVLSSPGTRRPAHLPPELAAITTWSSHPSAKGVDVLYLPGLPQQRGDDCLREAHRAPFRFDTSIAADLPDDAVVLSPLPVVDEIAGDVRADPRLRMFDQSDRGVFVRMALLQWVLSKPHRQGPG
jgi:aspartate carbamoyltransferase catalytic subunit